MPSLTITGTGDSSVGYVQIGSTKYYSAKSGLSVAAGTQLTFAGTNWHMYVNVNGQRVYTSEIQTSKSYVWTVPSGIADITIALSVSGSYASTMEFTADVTTVAKAPDPPKTHRTLVGGTSYAVKSGRCRVSGTNYSVNKGRALVGGTGYDVAFGTPIGDLAVGTSIYLRENGSLVEYIVVHQGNPDTTKYQSACAGTWVLRKVIYSTDKIDKAPYHESALHLWFDSTFTPLFDAATQSKMKLMRLPWLQNKTTPVYGDSGFLVKIFLLSLPEVGGTNTTDGATLAYFNESTSSTLNTKRIAYNSTGTAVIWFTRSVWTESSSCRNYCISVSGSVATATASSNARGIRPCMILDPSAAVDPTTMELLA